MLSKNILIGYCSFLAGMIITFLFLCAFDRTYKDGQIDAINGNIKYELVKRSDGTTKWEYKK